MAEPDFVELQPEAGIFLESIRNVGYSFETAVADIVDNSVSAKSKNIDIRASYKTQDGCPAISISDDGFGMSEDTLVHAMRFAHQDLALERAASDLGRFGLGMKLASLSQARKLLVVSRTSDGIPAAALWDIDYVKRCKHWSLQIFSGDEARCSLSQLLEFYGFTRVFERWYDKKHSGTVVFWLGMDRFSGDDIDTRLFSLRSHLSLVFHRFLGRGIHLNINGGPIEATDPYLTDHPKCCMPAVLAKDELKISSHVLPYMTDLDEADWNKLGITASFKTGSLKAGFYIYRADRLIVWGRWFGMVTGCPSKKIVRVELDIGTDNDAEWQIDVRKSKAEIPERFHRFILSTIRQALKDSQRKFMRAATDKSGNVQDAVWSITEGKEKGFWAVRVNRDSQYYLRLKDKLGPEETKLFHAFIERLEGQFPYGALYAQAQMMEGKEDTVCSAQNK